MLAYLNGILDGEAGDGVLADNLIPRNFEGFGDDLLIGGEGAPDSADAAGASEVGNRELLEDEAEGVAASQGREVRVHRGYRGGGVGGVAEGWGGDVGVKKVDSTPMTDRRPRRC
ncbi:hypothetical protein PS2_003884 [Malus domestica]